MKLSVVLPTYNGAKFLRQQIESILAQTDPDLELLTIDDGSTDETVSILDEYATKDNRVKRFAASDNRGQRIRLAEIAQAAQGQYIAISDQDDVWKEDRNGILIDAIGTNAVAFGRSQLIDENGMDMRMSVLESLGVNAHKSGRLTALFSPLLSAHAAIVRREWLNKCSFHSIIPFDLMIGLEALYSDGLVYKDSAVVYHRMHGANQTNGAVLKPKHKLLSRSKLNESLSFVSWLRLELTMTLYQLSESAILSADVRRTFKMCADQCRYAWYQPIKFSISKNRDLRRYLTNALANFASSDDDLSNFHFKVNSLTRGQFSSINAKLSWQRYMGRHDK